MTKRRYRHILEVRFQEKSLSFMDIKGRVADSIAKKTGWKQARVDRDRVDIFDVENRKAIFVSAENIGFQVDNAPDFTTFQDMLKMLHGLIDGTELNGWKSVSRLGVKSVLYEGFEKNNYRLKRIYRDELLSGFAQIENIIGGNIVDVGIQALDLKDGDLDLNINTGPMSGIEVIEKVFKDVVYGDLEKIKEGIYLEIDVSKKNLLFSDSQQLLEAVSLQEKKLRESQEKFLDIFKAK